MENPSVAQETLLKVTKIVETQHAADADALLHEGFVLLAVSESSSERSEYRFVYSLGYPNSREHLSEWVINNF